MCPTEIGVIFLIFIVGIIMSVLFYKKQNGTEGFANKPPQTEPKQLINPNITFCPFNSTAVIIKSGDTLCCDGKTSTRHGCLEKTVCSLSNSQGKNYKSCAKVYAEYIQKMSKEKCFPLMPNYFEKRDGANKDVITQKGCYAGPTKVDRYEPVSNEQLKCIVIDNQRESIFNPNSCSNQKELHAVYKPLPNTAAKFISFNSKAPPLLQVSFPIKQKVFGGEMEMPINTYTIKSIIRYWNEIWPDYNKFNFNNLTAEQLGTFIYEIRLDIILNKLAPTKTNIWKNYVAFYVLKRSS